MLRNFILADSLELDFSSGFGVLTGETGAGKSILLDALQCVTGARADIGMIRDQQERAEVSARFKSQPSEAINALLTEWGIEAEDDILLRRVLDRSGRHKAYINGIPVTLNQLAQVGGELLEIHGQHESMQLMRPHQQRQLLDTFANILPQISTLTLRWNEWQALNEKLLHAQKHQEEFELQRESLLLRQQDLADILNAEAWDALNHRHQQLAHVQSLQEQAYRALALLDEEEINGAQLLRHAEHAVSSMLAVDKSVSDIHSILVSAHSEIAEATRMLRHYLDKLEGDPETLQNIELQIQHQMDRARKYRTPPESLEALRLQTEIDVATLNEGQDINALIEKTRQAEQNYRTLATTLSQQRTQAAQRLSKMVSARLPELGMKSAQINVVCTPTPAGPTGVDTIEFQVSGLAGSGWRPMAKVVSGGELSRLALAIFLAISGDTPKTFVFDEIDAGIGGAVAETVGRLLSELARKHSHSQILCVTHLPQVASCALWHGLVEKTITEKDAVAKSHVTVLHGANERIEEISRMLGGRTITSATREHAKEMLEASNNLNNL